MNLAEFKTRLPIVDIIRRYVKLTKKGQNWLGLCPFHNEKTPSFTVSEDKGFFHCFGCQASGSAIDFIMQAEGLEFRDALERLSQLTGIEAPQGSAVPHQQAKERSINEEAGRFFRQKLLQREGERARAYLQERGVSPQTALKFQIGLAPGQASGLTDYLKSCSFSLQDMEKAGLVILEQGKSRPYERFSDRLMFPITDHRGQVAGFGGRTLVNHRAKYLNSPETPFFQKSQLLFNLANARKPAHQNKRICVVEGYLDVIALSQAGIEEAVAPLGTAISTEQLLMLWKVCDEPHICFDGDSAGQAAALRAAKKALPSMKAGKGLNFVMLPKGEDPDSLIRAQGKAAFEKLLSGSLPLSELVFVFEKKQMSDGSAEQWAALKGRLQQWAGLAQDQNLRSALFSGFSSRLWQERRGSGSRSRGGFKDTYGYKERNNNAGVTGTPQELQAGLAHLNDPAKGILTAIIAYPQLLREFEETIAMIEIHNRDFDHLRQEILTIFALNPDLDFDHLKHQLLRRGLGKLLDKLNAQPGGRVFVRGGPDQIDENGDWSAAMLERVRHKLSLKREEFRAERCAREGDIDGLNRALQAKNALINLALGD